MIAIHKINTNKRFRLKLDYIINKLTNEFAPKAEKKSVYKNNNSQRLDLNNLVNTHNPSQADNLQNVNPSLRSLEHQAIEQSQNNINNNNNISLGLLPQQQPKPQIQQQINTQGQYNQNINREPEAANSSGGGFSSW
jgi:hypothetical protein